MKRIVLTDESLNSYGFWVLTSGMDLSAFLRNPVMLWNHNRSEGGTVNDQLPIGYWKDLRVEADGSITAEPVFDETDEFAVKIKKKYESGVLNASSIGFRILEWSEDPKFLKPGQTMATATKSVLLEASICDIPSNPNATKVVLYNENSETINLSDLPNMAIGPNINNKMTKEIALKLGLDENASPQAILAAIVDLKSENASYEATVQNLELENKQLKERWKEIEEAKAEAQRQEVVSLLDEAVKTGRIDTKARKQFEKLFELDYEAAKATLAALQARTPLKTAEPASEAGDLAKMSWDELDKSERLIELKTRFPELYQQKFNEKFHKKH